PRLRLRTLLLLIESPNVGALIAMLADVVKYAPLVCLVMHTNRLTTTCPHTTGQAIAYRMGTGLLDACRDSLDLPVVICRFDQEVNVTLARRYRQHTRLQSLALGADGQYQRWTNGPGKRDRSRCTLLIAAIKPGVFTIRRGRVVIA
ncbi:MAG: hypothetical protein ACOC3G_08965, partial [Phycisphaeraceae bacterium]